MIMQLINMYTHIIRPSLDGNQYMTEVMTQFHLLSPNDKKKVCYQLLTFPEKTYEGLTVVDYLLISSEYRRDFPTWAHDKGIYIRYRSLKNQLQSKKSV